MDIAARSGDPVAAALVILEFLWNIRKFVGVLGMCDAHRSVADRSRPWSFSWPAPQGLPYANNGEFTAV